MVLINCPECGKEISDKAMMCPGCGIAITGGLFAYEFKSKTKLFGIPLVHIVYGPAFNPVTKQIRIAKGIIAIGPIAIGVLSLGGISIGGFCLGGVAAGIMALGGFAIGLLLAIGGLAVGFIALGGAPPEDAARTGWISDSRFSVGAVRAQPFYDLPTLSIHAARFIDIVVIARVDVDMETRTTDQRWLLGVELKTPTGLPPR